MDHNADGWLLHAQPLAEPAAEPLAELNTATRPAVPASSPPATPWQHTLAKSGGEPTADAAEGLAAASAMSLAWHDPPIPSAEIHPEPRGQQSHGQYGRDAHSHSDDAGGRTWQDELARWLATLDSQRTRREYEKAVSYFFATPGVPVHLADLTPDLLLAYRGSLALRAERRRPATHYWPGATSARHEHLAAGADVAALPPDNADADTDGAPPRQDYDSDGRAMMSALAPATVNIRLTALRQFLAHCALWGHTPALTTERMRAALRRLGIERRRPYQVLAEPEWGGFLQAARAPAHRFGTGAVPTDARMSVATPGPVDPAATSVAPAAPSADTGGPRLKQGTAPATSTARGPWGIARAARADSDAVIEQAPKSADSGEALSGAQAEPRGAQQPQRAGSTPTDGARPAPPHRLVRTRAGLTGEHTALRDHALLALALATGLRAVELCELDLADIGREWHAGQEEWWLSLPDAKTKGQRGGRTLPLAAPLMGVLLEYVASTGRQWSRPTDRATPLFLSLRRSSTHAPSRGETERPQASPRTPAPPGRLSTTQVRRIVDRVETQWYAAQNEGGGGQDGHAHERSARGGDARAISPHALRHSTAVALLEGNESNGRLPASVEHVRGWLGHFDIRTTQGYLAHLEARRHRRPFVLVPTLDTDNVAPGSPDSRQAARDRVPPDWSARHGSRDAALETHTSAAGDRDTVENEENGNMDKPG